MKSHSNRLDNGLRAALLACILVIVYAGPASAFALHQIFDEDFFGPMSGGDAMVWIGFVWLFAVPLILGYRWWDDNPRGSTTAIATFLAIMLLLWIVTRQFGVLVLGLALAAPAQIFNDGAADVDTVYYAALVLALLVCIVIPVSAMAFQISRKEDWARMQYESF